VKPDLVLLTLLGVALIAAACSAPEATIAVTPTSLPAPTATSSEDTSTVGLLADVIDVSVSGSPGAYSFSVAVRSPDTGCEQYADWWEVVNPEGELIYRRVLLHSHTSEQPFTRSGGPVDVRALETVILRAHMNTSGYGGLAFQGSVSEGFQQVRLSGDFATEVQHQQPLPSSCAF
jgi:hypothetical protein